MGYTLLYAAAGFDIRPTAIYYAIGPDQEDTIYPDLARTGQNWWLRVSSWPRMCNAAVRTLMPHLHISPYRCIAY